MVPVAAAPVSGVGVVVPVATGAVLAAVTLPVSVKGPATVPAALAVAN
jgi:hypothetical protein